jgi:hypothetical protein
MTPMKINKANHSMIGYEDKISSIGGINNNKCELCCQILPLGQLNDNSIINRVKNTHISASNQNNNKSFINQIIL